MQPPGNVPNADNLFQSLPLSAADIAEWIKEHGGVTHKLFQQQQFEVIDVKANVNGFSSMISVGLAFHEATNICSHARIAPNGSKKLSSQFVSPDFRYNFEGYVAHMVKEREWASMLERDIISDLFKCNILIQGRERQPPKPLYSKSLTALTTVFVPK